MTGHNFVLVHGAFHGGWCWRRVADDLRGRGHRVFTPTLTGLGERAHLLDESVGLESSVTDIVSVIETEELTQVVLVGHSFGGLTLGSVADRLSERLRCLVYLDALVVPSGRSPWDMVPAGEAGDRAAAFAPGAIAFDPFPAEAFGVTDPDDAAWLERRMTPQPLRPYLEPVHLDHRLGNGLPVTYISCTQPVYEAIEPSRDIARAQRGWQWRELACSHDAMVIAPGPLSEMLHDIAQGTGR